MTTLADADVGTAMVRTGSGTIVISSTLVVRSTLPDKACRVNAHPASHSSEVVDDNLLSVEDTPMAALELLPSWKSVVGMDIVEIAHDPSCRDVFSTPDTWEGFFNGLEFFIDCRGQSQAIISSLLFGDQGVEPAASTTPCNLVRPPDNNRVSKPISQMSLEVVHARLSCGIICICLVLRLSPSIGEADDIQRCAHFFKGVSHVSMRN